MNKYVILDASAVLALLNSEKGSEIVEKLLPHSVMSTVNIAEVIAELDKKLNISPSEGKEIVRTTISKILPLDFDQSIETGRLRKITEQLGLSLGDRACLALAIHTGYPVYTADKSWSRLDLNCKIICIR